MPRGLNEDCKTLSQTRAAVLDELRSLSESQPPEAALPRAYALATHPDSFIRQSAVDLIASIHSPQSISMLAALLNDRSEYVAESAANGLAAIGGQPALRILADQLAGCDLERPHFLANAIASFGAGGVAVLSRCAKHASPNVRYYAARGLGSTGRPEVETLLLVLQKDQATTTFGGKVATGAKDGLRTLRRLQRADV